MAADRGLMGSRALPHVPARELTPPGTLACVWPTLVAFAVCLFCVDSVHAVTSGLPAADKAWCGHERAHAWRQQHVYTHDSADQAFRVHAENLTEVVAGQEVSVFIEKIRDVDSFLELFVWLNGPAQLAGEVVPHTATLFEARFVALDTGDYELFVEVVSKSDDWRHYNKWVPVEGSPFAVTVHSKDLGASRCGQDGAAFALPEARCTGISDRPGRWIACSALPDGEGCLSEGSVWMPQDCKYKVRGSRFGKRHTGNAPCVPAGLSSLNEPQPAPTRGHAKHKRRAVRFTPADLRGG